MKSLNRDYLNKIDNKVITDVYNDEKNQAIKDIILNDLKLDYVSLKYSESGNKDSGILNQITIFQKNIKALEDYINFIDDVAMTSIKVSDERKNG
jgi:NAD kinase